ncbi:MAG: DoxX family protein [Acidobacteria bacterium]|nr:DoxX family protein [Acidobacteriota bacterium]
MGFGFVYHGFPKLFLPGEREVFVGMLRTIGVPQPGLMAWAVGALEFVGGLALIVGAFVVIFGCLLTINMLVALFTVHLPQGFNFMHITGMAETGPTFGMPGYEVNLLYIAGLLVLILGGAGAFSVDRRRSHGRPGGFR